ncbi:unnamed protein product [Rhizophagus irregularis]|nr:unnamed protein product [Rhizophagus irregularis]
MEERKICNISIIFISVDIRYVNNQKSYKKKNQADDKYLDKVDHIDLTQYENQQGILYQILSHRRQQRSVNLKQLPVSLNISIQNNSMPSMSESNTKAISFQHTEKTTIETSIKWKKFNEFSDLPTKHIKSNANNTAMTWQYENIGIARSRMSGISLRRKFNTCYTQSILEKILEEQLKQHITIEANRRIESNVELKCKILKNYKLI